jgi:beta-1,4-mannosyl-glycoprotein beta-1,4-N-acetylglucosaminyltransferase
MATIVNNTGYKRLVVDGFMFYNELELLSYRLKILNDVVDYFVLVECTRTFVGNSKPLIFNENKTFFSEYSHKIIHIIVDDVPFVPPNINIASGDQWKNEEWQRNAIATGFAKVNHELQDNDILMITDLDEIPDPRTIQRIKDGEMLLDGISILYMDLYYYNLHVRYTDRWDWPKILLYGKYKELNTTCSFIRRMTNCPRIADGAGWHLSYFGDYEFMRNKTENWSHQELNNSDNNDLNNIADRVKRGVDLYNRPWVRFNTIKLSDNTYLPIDYDKYLTKYYTVDDETEP